MKLNILLKNKKPFSPDITPEIIFFIILILVSLIPVHQLIFVAITLNDSVTKAICELYVLTFIKQTIFEYLI